MPHYSSDHGGQVAGTGATDLLDRAHPDRPVLRDRSDHQHRSAAWPGRFGTSSATSSYRPTATSRTRRSSCSWRPRSRGASGSPGACSSFFLGLQLLVRSLVIALAGVRAGQPHRQRGTPSTAARTAVLVATSILVTGFVCSVLLIWARKQFYAPVRTRSFRRALARHARTARRRRPDRLGARRRVPGHAARPAPAPSWSTPRRGARRRLPLHQRASSAEHRGWVNLLLGLLGAIAVLAGSPRCSARSAPRPACRSTDEQRIRDCSASTAIATRSATSRPGGTSPRSSRRAARRRSPTASSTASAWPAEIRSAMSRRGARRSRRGRRSNQQYAWVPAVMGASEDGAVAYQRAGSRRARTRRRGDPARGRVHARRPGYATGAAGRQSAGTGRLHGPASAATTICSADEMADVVKPANDWRDTDSERGFSMALGRLGDPADGAVRAGRGVRRHGTAEAMLSLSPWGPTGLSLDLMRRDHEADNGVMELMVAGLMRDCPRLGVARISLNFAVFRSVFEEGARIGAGPILRLWRHTLLFFSRWWQLESLYRSNMKYQPEWVPALPLLRRTSRAGEDRRRLRDRRGLPDLAAVGARCARSRPSLAPGVGGGRAGPSTPRPRRRRRRR